MTKVQAKQSYDLIITITLHDRLLKGLNECLFDDSTTEQKIRYRLSKILTEGINDDTEKSIIPYDVLQTFIEEVIKAVTMKREALQKQFDEL